MKASVVLALAAGLAAATLVQAADPSSVRPLAWRERRLANGLQVVSVESHASPTVGVQVWYHVGGRDDPAGRSGFAHLFEHLMFKGTKHLAPEQFDRLTEDVGGSNNAFTGDDVTAYQSVVPSNHLERLLWAEAERMADLDVNEANFKSERAVVEEEYRERILASPYGRLFNAIASASYRVHPYRRPVIGRIDDLESATLADVIAFHARWYRPDNATLVVAGDFEPAQLDAWVDRYFGRVARPAEPLPAFAGDEPPWPDDRTVVVTAPRVPLPAVAVTWLAPPATSPDAPALQVAAAVLAAGESSRLNQSLVYRQQVATQAGFTPDLRAGPGLLTAFAIAAAGQTTERLAASLRAEVERLAERPPSAAEIDKVKNQLVTDAWLSRQTPEGVAGAIADAAVIGGDPGRIDTDLADLQRVTPADVQRVVRRYVVGAHRTTIVYRQEAK